MTHSNWAAVRRAFVARTMLFRVSTMPRRARILGFASSCVLLFASPFARAQVTGPIIAQGSQLFPDRIVNGVTVGTRPQNLNPLGINYQDCASDMTLHFALTASGFNGSQLVEVWAGTSDCSSDTSRGVGSVPSCWQVQPPIAGFLAGSTAPLFVDARVQDLAGHLNNVPMTATYSPLGAAGCLSQTVDTAQSVSIFFLPTDASGHALSGAQGYTYPIKVDLVGPPAPASPGIGDGDTLFVVQWTPNTDTDTAGYNVYIDPIPGQEGTTSAGVGGEPVLVCPDAGVEASSTDATVEASVEGGDDASGGDSTIDDAEAGDASGGPDDASGPADAVCYYLVSGGGSNTGACGSSVLSSTGVVIDGGAAVATTDEAGTTTTTGGAVGISNIPPQFLVGATPPNITVSDRSSGSYTITGLKNGTNYTVVVAAVDGFGNVGPPSGQKCDYPAPVNDFWNQYRQGGGRSGGNLCALEEVGLPAPALGGGIVVATSALAMIRRRRRR
jgi:hypothetical protein